MIMFDGNEFARASGVHRRVGMSQLLMLLLLASGLARPQSAVAAGYAPSVHSGAGTWAPGRRQRADFAGEAASAEARRVADWIVDSGDNQGLPFLIVDKVDARLFLFDAPGSVRAVAPVLLGSARGDDSPPGIGDRKLSLIAPADRITPAGRFVASRGENLAGQDILWVDYAAAISLHRATDVKAGLTAKGRLARLASASTLDNRISHGCINVSVKFYDSFIRPAFNGTAGIVYILPETRSVGEVFHIPGSSVQAQAAVTSAKLGS